MYEQYECDYFKYLYNPLFIHLDPSLPQGRIRKPSKRQLGTDTAAPLTPAPPPKARSRLQNPPATPQPGSFASRRIQESRKKTAATVLFTPRTKQHQRHLSHSPTPGHQQPPSPCPFQASEETSQLALSDSEVEEEVRAGLEKLDLQPQSDDSAPDSPPSNHPKVKTAKTVKTARPKGGAKDVWNFYEKSSDRNICIICK